MRILLIIFLLCCSIAQGDMIVGNGVMGNGIFLQSAVPAGALADDAGHYLNDDAGHYLVGQ